MHVRNKNSYVFTFISLPSSLRSFSGSCFSSLSRSLFLCIFYAFHWYTQHICDLNERKYYNEFLISILRFFFFTLYFWSRKMKMSKYVCCCFQLIFDYFQTNFFLFSDNIIGDTILFITILF